MEESENAVFPCWSLPLSYRIVLLPDGARCTSQRCSKLHNSWKKRIPQLHIVMERAQHRRDPCIQLMGEVQLEILKESDPCTGFELDVEFGDGKVAFISETIAWNRSIGAGHFEPLASLCRGSSSAGTGRTGQRPYALIRCAVKTCSTGTGSG